MTHAVFTLGVSVSSLLPAGSVPPDTGQSLAGSQGLACSAGTAGLANPAGNSSAGGAGGWPPCTPCAAGTFAADSATVCMTCAAGEWSSRGAASCLDCPEQETLSQDSPIMLPGNAAQCTACGLCCTAACVAIAATRTTTAAQSPTTAVPTTNRAVQTTPTPTRPYSTSGAVHTTMSSAVAAAAVGITTTAAAPAPVNVCGNGIREHYPTSCWCVWCPRVQGSREGAGLRGTDTRTMRRCRYTRGAS